MATNITQAADKARAERDKALQDRHPEYAALRGKANAAEEAYMNAPREERNQRATDWLEAERKANDMMARLITAE